MKKLMAAIVILGFCGIVSADAKPGVYEENAWCCNTNYGQTVCRPCWR